MLGRRPSLMSRALVEIHECSDCLKMWVSLVTGTCSLEIKSPSTFPGPTGGSWSTSPTKMRRALFGMALIKRAMSHMSTIEDSSTMTAWTGRGLYELS